MDNTARVAKAEELKAAIDRTRPVTEWKMTAAVLTNLKGDVRVCVNDRKGKPAAILVVDQDGKVNPEWQKGHSLTRDELRSALQVK
jgi:hypothetical protein